MGLLPLCKKLSKIEGSHSQVPEIMQVGVYLLGYLKLIRQLVDTSDIQGISSQTTPKEF